MLSSDHYSAAEVIELLKLQPIAHEGGYYRRVAESSLRISADALPAIYRRADTNAERRAYSVIFALFTPEQFSAMHRLVTDEIWCFHAGDPLESLRLSEEDGRGEWVQLGLDVCAGQHPHDVVPANVWQGTRLISSGRWALVSCIVAPEFRWTDFELGSRAALIGRYGQHAEAIRALTRET